MDLKDWKKLSHDGKSCTLIHPKGHTMSIAVKALPKIQQEAIKRLPFADGGKVESNDHLASGKDGMSQQGNDVRASNRMKKNGDPNSSLFGEFAKDEAKGRAKMERTIKPNIKGLAHGGKVNYYDEGTGDVQPADDSGSSDQPGVTGNHTPITINVGVPNASQGQPPPPPARFNQRDAARAVPVAAAPTPQINPIPAAPGPNLISPDQTLDVPAAVKLQQDAARQQQAIESEKGTQNVANEQERIDSENQIRRNIGNNINELRSHTDDFANYIHNNPVNPRAYMENMGTGQKVGTAIGLMLGGFKQGFSGGNNPAMDFMNQQIDRDIKAQQQRADNEKTVWGAYRDLYHDENIATNMAKVSANDMLVHRTNLTAAQLGTAQAKANADAFAAQKGIENNNLLLESAARKGQLDMGGSTPGKPQASNPKNMDKWYEDHILSPTADRDSLALKFNPLYKDNLGAIQEQKAKADLADKALSTINERFSPIGGSVGESTYARNHLEPFMGSLPFVGGALAHTTHTFTDNPSTRNYDIDRSAIVGAVRGALQGNVSDELLDSTVSANLPEKGDSPEILSKKMRTLKEFIKSHTKTDLLRSAKLSRQ